MRGARLADGNLTALGPNHGGNGSPLAMYDVIYLIAGFAVFAVVGLYAYACDRL